MTFKEANVYYNSADNDEKLFLNHLMSLMARNHLLADTNLFKNPESQPYVPGIVYPNSSLFYSDLIEKYLKQASKLDFSLSDCSLSDICQKEFIEANQLARDTVIMCSVKDYSADFHSKRADLYFGQFLRNFEGHLSLLRHPIDWNELAVVPCPANSISDQNKSLVSGLLVSYFFPVSYNVNEKSSNCVNASTGILKQFPETFLEIIKHSFLKNSLSTNAIKMEFISIYEESLRTAFRVEKIELPVHLSDQVEMISFCTKTSKNQELQNNVTTTTTCNSFNPILTSKGPCFTYNAFSMPQLYNKTGQLVNWINVFDHETINILPSDGYGPKKAFMFVLNSFDKYLEKSKSLNFMLTISNAYEPHLMMKNINVIQPGYVYTVKVIANQIVSTAALNNMNPTDRNCLLNNENGNLTFSKYYTKSTCEYECIAYQAVEECGCAPWYIPFFEDKPYCDVQTHCGFYSDWDNKTICDVNENCFQSYLNNATTDQCNCPMECEGTDYSIIKSNQQLHLPQNFCTNEILKTQYPFYVYCEMCEKIIQFHKIRLIYDYYISNKPNPDNINAFCHYFISNYTALVKIEMVSKSVMRSVRDKRFSLMSQVSQLGKN
jgi:hypothetical protein